jgi:hypothetical protein
MNKTGEIDRKVAALVKEIGGYAAICAPLGEARPASPLISTNKICKP